MYSWLKLEFNIDEVHVDAFDETTALLVFVQDFLEMTLTALCQSFNGLKRYLSTQLTMLFELAICAAKSPLLLSSIECCNPAGEECTLLLTLAGLGCIVIARIQHDTELRLNFRGIVKFERFYLCILKCVVEIECLFIVIMWLKDCSVFCPINLRYLILILLE